MNAKMRLFGRNAVLKAVTVLLVLSFGCSDDAPEEPIDPIPVNKAPTAVAGEDQKAELETIVKLDASGSKDPDQDELSYTWSLKSRPENSSTSIIGVGSEKAEFTIDKAGSYEVELIVSDGKLEASDSFMVTNKTPILSEVSTSTNYDLSDDLAQIGREIYISGDYFSKDVNEMNVTIGGVTIEIEDLYVGQNGGGFDLTVPVNAVSGDLVVSVGSETVTWPKPIRIASIPTRDYVEANVHLERHTRVPKPSQSSEFYEIGTLFKPLVNGTVETIILKLPEPGDHKVTLWDATTKTVLTSVVIVTNNSSERYISLDNSIALEAGKEYAITFNSNHWYLHIDEENSQGNQFPQTFENIELISTAFHAGPDTFYPDEGFPINYITRGADIVFAADPQ